jgi:hypothetical protein
MADSSPARVIGRPFRKGESPGRLPGFPNKTTISVKAALEAAFQGLGGVPALIAWAEKEPAEFYRLWGKLLPRNVTIEGGAQLGIVILPPLGAPPAAGSASIGSVDGLERLEPTVTPLPALEASSDPVGVTVVAPVAPVGSEL